MDLISGRTTMSSRGQIVVPKALRDAAGLAEGDAIEVLFDGRQLCLVRLSGSGPGQEGVSEQDATMVRESEAAYRTSQQRAGSTQMSQREAYPSEVWAARVRALDGIKRLSLELGGFGSEEVLLKSRDELDRRTEGC